MSRKNHHVSQEEKDGWNSLFGTMRIEDIRPFGYPGPGQVTQRMFMINDCGVRLQGGIAADKVELFTIAGCASMPGMIFGDLTQLWVATGDDYTHRTSSMSNSDSFVLGNHRNLQKGRPGMDPDHPAFEDMNFLPTISLQSSRGRIFAHHYEMNLAAVTDHQFLMNWEDASEFWQTIMIPIQSIGSWTANNHSGHVTFPNGLRLAWGRLATTAAGTIVQFPDAFSVVFQIFTTTHTDGSSANVTNITPQGFRIRSTTSVQTSWLALGFIVANNVANPQRPITVLNN